MKPASPRARILDEGVNLISVRGVSGVTFGLLADAVGMSKSGLFAHFSSKEDAQLQLLDHAARLSAMHIVQPAQAAPAGLERLRALFGGWLGWSARAGLQGGCPLAAAFFEFDDMPGQVRDHLARLEEGSRTVLAEQADIAVRNGTFRADLDVDQLVWELGALYLAHHVSNRLGARGDATTRAMVAFDAIVDRARSR